VAVLRGHAAVTFVVDGVDLDGRLSLGFETVHRLQLDECIFRLDFVRAQLSLDQKIALV